MHSVYDARSCELTMYQGKKVILNNAKKLEMYYRNNISRVKYNAGREPWQEKTTHKIITHINLIVTKNKRAKNIMFT